MPHIIVEYSPNLEPEVNIAVLLPSMHAALASQGVDSARIKTRATALNHYVVGDKGNVGAMMHITLLLLEGRDDETKQQYSQPIYKVAVDAVKASDKPCAVTLEVRDMSAATYIL